MCRISDCVIAEQVHVCSTTWKQSRRMSQRTCAQQTLPGWIALKKNAGDRLCHSKRKLLVKEVKKRAEWQNMLNVSQIAQCSTSHCKWHQKDEEGLENTACCMHGKSYRLAVAVFWKSQIYCKDTQQPLNTSANRAFCQACATWKCQRINNSRSTNTSADI